LKLAALLAAALVAGSAVRVWNAGQPQVNAAHNPAVQLGASQGYLIPYDASVLGQWNASDLIHGTAKIGPAWTTVGAPVFNYASATLPPRISGFADTSYYSLAAGATNPMSPASPFSIIVVGVPTTLTSGGPTMVGAGNYGSTGYEFTIVSSPANGLRFVNDASSLQLFTANTAALNVPHVFMGGVGGGVVYAQLDNGTLASQSGGYSQNTTLPVYLGRNTPTSFPWSGSIIEVQIRAERPSAALFTAIYQSVEANL
jgi:hypothetical protein